MGSTGRFSHDESQEFPSERTSHGRRCSASLALPAGADAGQEDGSQLHLVAGRVRVHAHQRDADPSRPLGLRKVRQARRRLQHRCADRRDPRHPAHLGPAQHRAHRRGRLGQAIAGSSIFADHGFHIVTIFDDDPAKIGTELGGVAIRSTADLTALVAEHNIIAAVIAVPAGAAQSVADQLVKAGVHIIFNYSEALLQTPADVVVHSSSPAVELLHALYFYLT